MVVTLASARGFSTSELAKRIGIHRNRLADKIAGRQPFRESEILALAAALGVSPGQLFGDPVALLTGGSSSAWTTAVQVRRHLRAVAA
jgi:transcriptional regulator with XRE-family HTH domain